MNNQLFLIVNNNKVSRCYSHFTNKTGRYHPHSINRSTNKYYPYTTIEKPYTYDRAGKYYLYSINRNVGKYYLHTINENHK